jgi:metal-responsive CopG/Arc/MetJ family transcriptional regulator
MKRRTKQRMTAIHISIPVRLLEDFDDTLSFSQSRSAKISRLISQDIEAGGSQGISEASTRQLMAALTARDDVDETMKTLLLQILTK